MSTPRPRSVTLGCVYGGLGATLTAVVLFETLQGWGSLEMQEAVTDSLRQVGVSVDLDSVLRPLRWVVMGLLVAAIAGAVFAVHAARGHQASRIGLSVLSALAALAFLFSGVAGLLPAVVAMLVVYLLWSAPARRWFAEMNGRTPISLGAEPSVPAAVVTPPGPPAPVAPRTQNPFESTVTLPPPYDPAAHPEHAIHAPTPPARPRPATVALLVAGIGHAIGAAGSGLVLLVMVALRDQVVEQYRSNDLLREQLAQANVSADQMVRLGAALFGAWFVVSVLGLVATGLAATRRRAGWWALVVTSVVTAGTAALGLPLGLVWIAGAIVVIVQCCRPEAKAWFSRT